jgi:hypothetical protein
MDLKFLDLDPTSLCPVGWPLGRIQLARPSAGISNAPPPAELVKLSSQQLKRAAHLKQQIEQLQADLVSVWENQAQARVQVLPSKLKAEQRKSKTARRPS